MKEVVDFFIVSNARYLKKFQISEKRDFWLRDCHKIKLLFPHSISLNSWSFAIIVRAVVLHDKKYFSVMEYYWFPIPSSVIKNFISSGKIFIQVNSITFRNRKNVKFFSLFFIPFSWREIPSDETYIVSHFSAFYSLSLVACRWYCEKCEWKEKPVRSLLLFNPFREIFLFFLRSIKLRSLRFFKFFCDDEISLTA